jgi:hypothetical protein
MTALGLLLRTSIARSPALIVLSFPRALETAVVTKEHCECFQSITSEHQLHPGSPDEPPNSSALVRCKRSSLATGAQASFLLSDLATLAFIWCLIACLMLLFLKGEVLLLPKIAKTDVHPKVATPSSLNPALKQL